MEARQPGDATPGRDGEGGSGEQCQRVAPAEPRPPMRARRLSRLAVEVVHLMGPVDHGLVVCGGDDRPSLRAIGSEQSDDGGPGVSVLPDGGLVREHDVGAVEDRRNDRQPSHLAPGEVAWVGIRQPPQPEGLEQAPGALLETGRVVAELPRGEEHLVEDPTGDDRRARPLRDPREATRQLHWRESRGILAIAHPDRPLGGHEEAGQRMQDRRLPRSAATDECGKLPGCQPQGLLQSGRDPLGDDAVDSGRPPRHGQPRRLQTVE